MNRALSAKACGEIAIHEEIAKRLEIDFSLAQTVMPLDTDAAGDPYNNDHV